MKADALTDKDRIFLKKLGARIRKLRQERGWTLEETEEHGWRSWTHLQSIEAGKNITVVTFRRVAKLFKISPAKLWDDL
ncbi:MAG: helix-turn-helix domain-containing protein [Deltaproteobacteria bacterium]|nr:helix-turn-helix domain-containing protein [Deltaproteobacteria bacterium]